VRLINQFAVRWFGNTATQVYLLVSGMRLVDEENDKSSPREEFTSAWILERIEARRVTDAKGDTIILVPDISFYVI
jgi:hypothetical protein